MMRNKPQSDQQAWQTKLQNRDILAQRMNEAKSRAAKNGGGSYSAWSPDGSFKMGEVDKFGNEVNNTVASRSASAASNTTGTGDIDKDWTGGNPNFSFNNDDMMKQAKELSQLQLSNAKDMMGLSAGYRNSEYGYRAGVDKDTYSAKTTDDMRLNTGNTDNSIRGYTAKTTDDMRVNNQQFGFQDALQRLKQTHELGMQEGQFGQQKTMFNMQQEASSRQKFNDRVAAANLYNSNRSAFPGIRNFRG